MNRGVLQSSPVQQMMAAGNPSWWNINNLMRPPMMSTQHPGHGNGHHGYHQQPQQLSPSSSSSTTTNFLNSNSCSSNNDTISINNETNSLFQAHPYMNINMATTPSSSSWLDDHTNNQENHHHSHLPESWSQLLMGGVCMGEEEDQAKKIERWEDQVVINQHTNHHVAPLVDHHHQVKQETSSAMDGYGNGANINVYGAVATANHDQEFQIAAVKAANNWSSPSQLMNNNNNNNNNVIPTSSPQSCVTTFSSSNCNSVLDFSSSKSSTDSLHANHPVHERSSECNSTGNGGVLKKAKVQPSSTQSTFKVRKEKLGDRITALHQLVSPFGKTDTASVLLEAIGYIRFLQSQIEALSLPYLSNGAGNKRQPQPVQGERNCIFPEDPGQLLNDNCLKRKGGPEQDSYEEAKDLRSRGLCLVPVSCTLHVGSDNGADYWAPALGGGFR